MVTTLRAKFDGKVIVPVGPIDLPLDRELTFQVDVDIPQSSGKSGAQRLAEKLAAHSNSNLPADFSAQHDHYLYGIPKRENP
jgi:hypothetical protein